MVVVTPVDSTTVTVSWSEVQCFNGSGAVTHYFVQYWSICGGVVQNVTTNSLVQNVSGLALNVAVYTFRVLAVGSSQKMGPLSNPVNTVLYCADEHGHPVILVWMSLNHPVLLACQQVSVGSISTT